MVMSFHSIKDRILSHTWRGGVWTLKSITFTWFMIPGVAFRISTLDHNKSHNSLKLTSLKFSRCHQISNYFQLPIAEFVYFFLQFFFEHNYGSYNLLNPTLTLYYNLLPLTTPYALHMLFSPQQSLKPMYPNCFNNC